MLDRLGRPLARLVAAPLRHPLLALAPLAALLVGFAGGLLVALVPDPAIIEALRVYEPSVVTRIYDRAGQQYAEWLQQRREVVGYDQIAPVMVQAVVAAEDARFFQHFGVDPWGVLRAVVANLRCGGFCQGFSTITMQIPRNLDRYLGGDTWLPKDKNIERKLREVIYAIQIERHYTKEQIFTIYANQIFMGSSVYGFQSAAKFYFGKPISDVSLPEAALLAGMIQRPSSYRPDLHPEAALAKRNLILDRMAEEGFISRQQAAAAKDAPLLLAERHRHHKLGSYFVEEIRRQLIKRYGNDIYREGLQVYTTLDQRIQAAAERALDRGLRDVDKRSGWRGAERNLLEEGEDLDAYRHPRWEDSIAAGDHVPAVVVEASARGARVRVRDRIAELTAEDVEWTGQQRPDRLLRRGDVISVLVQAVGDDGALDVTLDQEPTLQGAILVVENHTGEVKALVGGRGFDESEFDRATQAVRQTGSIFKPFVYATAVAMGLTPSELFVDQPTTFRDPSTRQPYAPANFNDEYIGITSLAEALTKSRNVPTVKLQQKIGVENVIDMARKFGLHAPFGPYLSLALGVMDISVWEIVRAYTVFPNQGVLVEPHLLRSVYDRRGRLLERTHRDARKVMDADDAYVMSRILVAGIERGTGVRARPLARELGMMLGGKTGTTDNRTDVWYVGFSPHHTVGVWVGHDLKQPIQRQATGSNTALPIWIEVMRAAEQGLQPGELPMPANIELRRVDPRTGLVAGPVCDESIELAYIAGTAPNRVCGRTEHNILKLPPYQQAYFVSNGRFDRVSGR